MLSKLVSNCMIEDGDDNILGELTVVAHVYGAQVEVKEAIKKLIKP